MLTLRPCGTVEAARRQECRTRSCSEREGKLAARLAEVRAERTVLDAHIQGLQEEREARIAGGIPVDECLAVAERALSRLPQIAGLELRVSKVPERVERLESQIAKRPR